MQQYLGSMVTSSVEVLRVCLSGQLRIVPPAGSQRAHSASHGLPVGLGAGEDFMPVGPFEEMFRGSTGSSSGYTVIVSIY